MNSLGGDPQESGTSKPSLEWMYKPSALVDREDYLLGRTVDKSLKILEEAEKGNNFSYADEVEKDLTPLSIFKSQGSGPIDVIKKIKEDPLYQIQKKEEETLKQLLKNPVRMKELEKNIKERQAKLKKSKKGKKEKKKRRKRGHGHSSDEGDSSDEDGGNKAAADKAFKNIDQLLSAKLQSLKKSSDIKSRKRGRGRRSRSESDSDSSESDSEPEKRKSHRRDRIDTKVDDHRERREYHDRRHESSSSYDRRRRDQRDRPRLDEGRSSSRTSSSTLSNRPRPEEPKRVTKSLTEDDLERKRREMMDNAKWRDDQRTKTVSKYRTEEQKEKDEMETARDPDFIRKQLMEAASTGSVEKRIKSNSYNIQRSKFSMDSNFVKR